MACHAAMNTKFLSLSATDGVMDALAAMKKSDADIAPVTDENGATVGILSLKIIFENLLPLSVDTGGSIGGVHLGAGPGIAKRLNKILPLKVSDLMERKFSSLHPDTPLWEAVNSLVQNNGAPILVIEPKSGKTLGLLSAQSTFAELERLKDSEK
ncbi:MAG: CBS domain-containing protein [Alphaproteobacteria bacterium]